MKKRISLEILKTIAICMVVFNHTGENGFEMFRTAYGTALWYVIILFDVVSKAGVPLFFMISGALLLGKDEPIRDIAIKRVLRYAIIIVVFSFLYYIRLYIKNPEYGFSIKFFIKYIYSTPFIIPYWFLYSYLTFLIILPILRSVARTLKEKEYILLLCFSSFLWYAPVWETVFGLEPIAIHNGLEASYILFPIIGYGIANVLSDNMFTQKVRISVLILFIVNWTCSLFMNYREYEETGELSGTNIDRFAAIPAIAIFFFMIYLLEKKRVNMHRLVEKTVTYIGSATLSTYLFEDMLRGDVLLKMFNCTTGYIQRLIMCIPYTLCIIASGVVLSNVLRRIPVIKWLKL